MDEGPSPGADAAFDTMAAMPGHLLRRCQQIAVSLFLKECREVSLTPLQFAVLCTLAQHGPMDQARLGGLAALDRTTVGVVSRKLGANGLLTRDRSARDRRSVVLSITPEGTALMRRAMPYVRAAQERILAPLAPEERARFLNDLARIAEANNEHSRAPARA